MKPLRGADLILEHFTGFNLKAKCSLFLPQDAWLKGLPL